jgi:DNA-binding transcriptional LysR family regulator
MLRVRLSSIDTVCRMVERRVGIAVIPGAALQHHRKLAIQVIQLTDGWALRKLMIAFDGSRTCRTLNS